MSTSTENRLRSLERATEVRKARAELRRRIESGDVFAASILLSPPPETRTWTVGELLISQPRWGLARMRRLLGRLEIPEHTELGGPPIQYYGHRALTDRQRRALAGALGWQEEER